MGRLIRWSAGAAYQCDTLTPEARGPVGFA